jgi:hypothetical protein
MLLFLRVDLDTVHIEGIAITVIFIDTIHDSISNTTKALFNLTNMLFLLFKQ